MKKVDVVAVVGACAPERQRYAKNLSAATGRMLVTAARLTLAPHAATEAAALAPWSDRPAGAVAEFPSMASVVDVIGALTDPDAPVRLTGITCVVDAMHLLDDLAADDYVATERDTLGRVIECSARALLTVTQLEYASLIVLVNWEALSTPNLSAIMALVSHLSPRARLTLQRTDSPPSVECVLYGAGQMRSGWVALLNGNSDPHMTDPRVSALRYEQLRPLHPLRLKSLLDGRIEARGFGHVVRSSGFCRLATRPQHTLQWDHVGRTIAFHLAAIDDGVNSGSELLAVGQDLAFIGLDLDHEALRQALDEAALTDEELAAGPTAWAQFVDPFPTLSPARDLPN